ncbi:hypothetical protein AVEN_253425-1 [Araneus ventricosus]|uniref:Uncharacterized protein n=1 Tax=Araneus ventricosus TaxID=182803 RepID=A0A4Y2HG68_ARAVE|nr:hypothetical protein AVEN_253425-1 [Araneus ventricosus]
MPRTLQALKKRTTAAVTDIDGNMLLNVWTELDSRWDVCRVTKGAHIEHLYPQLDQVQESARPQKITNQPRTFKEITNIDERFMVKEESATSVCTRRWTPEGRSLALSIAFMLQLGIMEWPSRFG